MVGNACYWVLKSFSVHKLLFLLRKVDKHTFFQSFAKLLYFFFDQVIRYEIPGLNWEVQSNIKSIIILVFKVLSHEVLSRDRNMVAVANIITRFPRVNNRQYILALDSTLIFLLQLSLLLMSFFVLPLP